MTGGTATQGGVTGGETDGQGLNTLASGFSGDVFRVVAEEDRLIIQVSDIDPNYNLTTSLFLAMIDSWDGNNGTFGTDIINLEIYDGGDIVGNNISGGSQIAGFSQAYQNVSDFDAIPEVTATLAQNIQLGFNTNDPFWNEDAFSLEFDDLQVSSGTLTFVIYASSGSGGGSGFQGGNDESFAIDNFLVTAEVPEPSVLLLGTYFLLLVITRRQRC